MHPPGSSSSPEEFPPSPRYRRHNNLESTSSFQQTPSTSILLPSTRSCSRSRLVLGWRFECISYLVAPVTVVPHHEPSHKHDAHHCTHSSPGQCNRLCPLSVTARAPNRALGRAHPARYHPSDSLGLRSTRPYFLTTSR